jgi:hypothetical protein
VNLNIFLEGRTSIISFKSVSLASRDLKTQCGRHMGVAGVRNILSVASIPSLFNFHGILKNRCLKGWETSVLSFEASG